MGADERDTDATTATPLADAYDDLAERGELTPEARAIIAVGEVLDRRLGEMIDAMKEAGR